MTPFYLRSGAHQVAAIFQAPTVPARDTAVLIVPPFGWDDQTSYRPRRDWSIALAASGFASLRIDLPGTGDSSGTPRDPMLVDSWTVAVRSSIDWLRDAGARRVAAVALGAGGLITVKAIGDGAAVDDLVLWGVPSSGRALVREIRAFGLLERTQTGEAGDDSASGDVRAGGHVLGPDTAAALGALNCATLLASSGPKRALVLGRDGRGPDDQLLEALRACGSEVATNPGHGWGAALARAQSTSPTAIFESVNRWLEDVAVPAADLRPARTQSTATMHITGGRVCETPILFESGGRQLYAVLAEPVDRPSAGATLVLFNAGAIRRIGPNRMWTEAARRTAAAGIPVIRVDLEGIGDASGESSRYARGDDAFYTERLVSQARAVLDLASERGLPCKVLLCGLCSGAFWAFHAALADPRVRGVVALNPRMLMFDRQVEGRRDLRRIRRIATVAGFRNMLSQPRKLARLRLLIEVVARAPFEFIRQPADDGLVEQVRMLRSRGQRVHLAFSGAEPLRDELAKTGTLEKLEQLGVRIHQLPYSSHTLKPLGAQHAAHALIDLAVEAALESSPRAPEFSAREGAGVARRA